MGLEAGLMDAVDLRVGRRRGGQGDMGEPVSEGL